MAETEPSPEARKLLDTLNLMDAESEAAKEEASRYSDENIKLIKGDGQWRSPRAPLFLMNIIGNQFERKVAQVTETKPTFSISSRVPEFVPSTKVLDPTTHAILEEQDFALRCERMGRFGMGMGCAFVGTVWDPLRHDIAFSIYDPRQVFLDPAVTEAARLHEQASYLRIDHVWPLHVIRRQWPSTGLLVRADDRYSKFAKKDERKPRGRLASALSLPQIWKPAPATIQSPIEKACVSEYWYRDPDVGSFPGGRHIWRAGDVILEDKPNEYWDQLFPIDMLDWRMALDGPWGQDDIQDLKKLQESLNRLGDAIMRNALFNSQAWVIADTDAVDAQNWKSVTNEGGVIIKKRPLREFKREAPPQLPAYLFQMLQAIPGMADLLTGNADSMGKRLPKGGVDAVIDGLQSAGSPLARMIARRFEALVARVGAKVISRVIQFYNSDRLLTYYGPTGQLVTYLFEREKLKQGTNGPLKATDLNDFHGKFRFLVLPYSSMAMTKMQRAQVGLGLWQATGGRGYPFMRVLQQADVGDPKTLIDEATEEQNKGIVPMPSPPTKR